MVTILKAPAYKFIKKETYEFSEIFCEFCEIFKNIYFINISRRLLLNVVKYCKALKEMKTLA